MTAMLVSCATYSPKYAEGEGLPLPETSTTGATTTPAYRMFLIGDAGLSPADGPNPVLRRFKDRLGKNEAPALAVFLGDNIYPSGLPDPKDDPQHYAEAKYHLDAQLGTVSDFNGRTVFIPGNHDWYSEGVKGLKRQEKYVEDVLDEKDVFLPENGCPIEVEELSDSVVLIVVDSEWYITNWDRKPTINDDCEIKSRQVFLAELESEIKKYSERTILLALHHPMYSYGEHGGYFSFQQQLYPKKKVGPLPVLGSLINLVRTTGGVSPEDLYHKRYTDLRRRVRTLAQFGERVILASGHEHTLQFIREDGLQQIVSGAGAKKGSTNLSGGSLFSTGQRGYAVVDLMEDGQTDVRYYTVADSGEETLAYRTELFGPYQPPLVQGDISNYLPDSPQFQANARPTGTVSTAEASKSGSPKVKASIYTQEEIEKSGFYRKLWGERYREYYGRQVEVPVVAIDTLYGGLVPVRKGGGQQSKSLRLEHASGKQYVMRAMRKQAQQNLQAMVFQNQFVMGQLDNTVTENLLEDIYTGAHPYAPYALDLLMDSLDIYHTNPRLFYVPRQPALGRYNDDFGDELYMIEEHPSEGHEELASFGFAKDIESTRDMLEKLREDEKYRIDKESYIRARLFDMLVGDWDRHQDQWRWAEFKYSDSVVYKPIPRDRDQVFSILGDGWIGGVLTRLVPAVQKMEGFHEEIRNLRSFNTNPFPLDRILLSNSEREQWLAQARRIRSTLNSELIRKSLSAMPVEVQDERLEEIQRILLLRLEQLEAFAAEYHEILQREPLLFGTDKDDYFRVTGTPEKGVRVQAYRIIDGKPEKQFVDRVFYPEQTREIQIYGLDDKDEFEIDVPAGNRIRVRIIGGLGREKYSGGKGGRTTIFDFKSKKSDFGEGLRARKVLTDNYQINTFQPLQPSGDTNLWIPSLGFNPDDGFSLGASYSFMRMGFRRNPFTAKHSVSAGFFLATSGYDLRYTGEFAGLFGRWNLELETRYTSPNFTRNFFGFGNETENPDDELGLDYNRVRTRIFRFTPALRWRGPLGGSLRLGAGYERVTVEETTDRFVNTFYQDNGEESGLGFLNIFGAYSYENRNNPAFPTIGLGVGLEAGYTQRLEDSGNFGFVIPELSLDHKLNRSESLVLATRWKAHFNIGNGYEFYQGAQIGANDGPRSYRFQRFTGKTAYYQLTDLRWQFSRTRTGVLPVNPGIFAGFDYGRVWQPGDASSRWHNSYGGGFFINSLDVLNLNAALFHGADGFRFTFGFGFIF
ncbi:Calcineurin-like phosphoesterase [Robiginitalea myxolifaciens]|uniref:Calcineurin-like phosphoesterase n=2 Tax=Robiginitalea myxolifaciens TaxID=400055 RepID=A0A1I6G9C6_9FLAO|nr:Calcineurin-like phosphoesterase [Robiginitalea myxolifaciens]